MKRFFDNLLIDLIAAALMIGMLGTGYILRFPLPPGTNKELTLWGLTRHQWGDVHFWISLGLIAVILLHLCLHWQWIAISVKRKLSRRKAAPGSALVSGLMTFLVLVAVLFLFGWAAQSGVNKITEPGQGKRIKKRRVFPRFLCDIGMSVNLCVSLRQMISFSLQTKGAGKQGVFQLSALS